MAGESETDCGIRCTELAGGAAQEHSLTVQGGHHFTRLKQLDTLASDANVDVGFMGPATDTCSLPRTNPGNRLQYKRQNGPYKLVMIADGDNKLPYGNLSPGSGKNLAIQIN